MNEHGVVTPPRRATSNGIQKPNLFHRGKTSLVGSPDIHIGGKVTYIVLG